MRKALTALTLAFVATACADQMPTQTVMDETRTPVPEQASFQMESTSSLLSGIPVRGRLDGGGTFQGLLTITDFAIEDGQLVVSGLLEGTTRHRGVVTDIVQEFTNVATNLLSPGNNNCRILHLDLGPLDLNLLGLQVDLSRIILDVTAEPGAGNLLGNLLCAVAGLLDNPLGNLLELNNLLGQVNDLLDGLLGGL